MVRDLKLSSGAKRYLAGAVWILFFLVAPAAAEQSKRLKVVVAGSPPFVMRKGEQLDGFSLKVWREIARRCDYKYDLVQVDGVAAALEQLTKGQADVAVGPITITADRAQVVAFTQPYFKSSLGLLSRTYEYSLWKRLKPFFSRAFAVGALFLSGLLMLVGGLVWFFERKRNPEEFPPGLAGLGHGMWFAMVTMSTVGYGDKAPKSVAGRVVTSIWMLVATLSFSTLTAGISTALALSSIERVSHNDPEILYARRAAVVNGTTGVGVARHFGAEVVLSPDLPRAIDLLKLKQADVLVFDYPALQYYMARNPNTDLVLAESQLATQYYGIAVGHDSRLRAQLDFALLKLREEGDLSELESLWQKQLRDSP